MSTFGIIQSNATSCHLHYSVTERLFNYIVTGHVVLMQNVLFLPSPFSFRASSLEISYYSLYTVK